MSAATTSAKLPLPPPPSLPSSMEHNLVASTNTAATASSSSSSSSSSQILTQKVHTAISLNTTAASFASALDALSTLQCPTHDGAAAAVAGTAGTTKLDLKSIRTAIEQDALYHAKCLQDEMTRLVHIVKDMRSSIQTVVTITEGVKKSMTAIAAPIDHGVGGNSTGSDSTTPPTAAAAAAAVGGNNNNGSSNNSNMNLHSTWNSTSDAFEQEKKTAEIIAHAFHERNLAQMRYDSLSEFLKKYNLNEQDSELLEHFQLEQIVLDSSGTSSSSSKNEGGESSLSSMEQGMAFLSALQRISKMRNKLSSSSSSLSKDDKGATVSFGTHASWLGPASAMRMMENLALKQQGAFERLYHFLHSRLDLVARSSSSSSALTSSTNLPIQNDMDETLLHPFIQRAIYVLREVPAYHRHTLELIASSRRAEVTRKFLLALTSGVDGMAPMEMKAHDPVNYVGDMLAFVFRTLSVESELAKGLFVEQSLLVEEEEGDGEERGAKWEGHDGDDTNDGQGEDGDEYAKVTAVDVLNDVMSGVARPLKSRLLHIITSLSTRPEEDGDDHLALVGGLHDEEEEAGLARNRLASLYSICGLLVFYQSAMEKAIGKLEKSDVTSEGGGEGVGDDNLHREQMNPVVQCLRECLSEGAKGFMASVKVYVATLEPLASSSSESQAAVASEMILRLCQVRGASPGFGIVMENMDEETSNALCVEFLCDHVYEPVFPLCTDLDDVVAMKAALSSMNKVGLDAGHFSQWQNACAEKEKTLIDFQIESDVKDFLQESGLGGICSAMENMEAVYVEGMVASSHPGLSHDSLRKAIDVFYTTLYDPPIPSYVGVKDPALKKYAKNKVVENITAVYEKIYDLACGEKGGYPDISFFKYDSSQVKAMLSS